MRRILFERSQYNITGIRLSIYCIEIILNQRTTQKAQRNEDFGASATSIKFIESILNGRILSFHFQIRIIS